MHVRDDGLGLEFGQHLPGVRKPRTGITTKPASTARRGGPEPSSLRADEQHGHALRARIGHAALSIKYRANSKHMIVAEIHESSISRTLERQHNRKAGALSVVSLTVRGSD
jgi:hypothetical protein